MIGLSALLLAALLPEGLPTPGEAASKIMVQCPYGGSPRITQEEYDAKVTSWTGRGKDWEPEGAVDAALISSPSINYPKRFLKPYQQATVFVVSFIDENGGVGDSIVECSTDEFFEESALELTKGQRYFPARDPKGPIRVVIRQPIIFDRQ